MLIALNRQYIYREIEDSILYLRGIDHLIKVQHLFNLDFNDFLSSFVANKIVCSNILTIIFHLKIVILSSWSSVDRAPVRCSRGHGFESYRDFFLVPCPCHVDCITFHKIVIISLFLPCRICLMILLRKSR